MARLPRPSRLRPVTIVVAVLVLVAVMAGATLIGAAGIGWTRVAREIIAQVIGGTSPLSEQEAAIVWQLRVPRVVLAGQVQAARSRRLLQARKGAAS